MFGKFVLSFLLFFSLSSFGAQMGTVVVEEAFIYLSPDFDATVIATAKRGETFPMSSKTQGPFYKVKLKDQRLGWISSVDIKSGKVNTPAGVKKEKVEKNKPLESHTAEKKANNIFAILRYQGFFAQFVDWKEKTLGKTRKDNLLFYGWNWTGFDTLVEGPFYIDSRIMATFQAPDYYKKVTSIEAKGWILKAQVSFVSANPLGDNFLFHYGFGASSTFSHFETGILEAGTKKSYSMDDVGIGVVIPIGFSYRVGSFSTQIFYQYYVEKTPHSGYSLGLNWAF